MFCGTYASDKFYGNTCKLYGTSYVSIEEPWHKIIDHIIHREILSSYCQYSNRHLMPNWIRTAWPDNKFLSQNVVVTSKFVCMNIGKILFQTWKTISALIRDIALVHEQETSYRHFDSHKTTLQLHCDLRYESSLVVLFLEPGNFRQHRNESPIPLIDLGCFTHQLHPHCHINQSQCSTAGICFLSKNMSELVPVLHHHTMSLHKT